MTAPDPRAQVSNSIEHAIADLAEALVELDRIPSIGFVVHAMHSYLSVTDATLGLLRETLRDHPNPDVAIWLDGLCRVGSMMQHGIARLPRTSRLDEIQLNPEYMNVLVLMKRACDYYRRIAQPKEVQITFGAIGQVPSAWADRVALAVVADNLLANAVTSSKPGGEVLVQIMPGPGGVVCSVRDDGPGFTPLEQVRLFNQAVAPEAPTTPGGDAFGLRIAKDFVDRMGGRLWLDSEHGRGACFSFRVPYHPARPRSGGDV